MLVIILWLLHNSSLSPVSTSLGGRTTALRCPPPSPRGWRRWRCLCATDKAVSKSGHIQEMEKWFIKPQRNASMLGEVRVWTCCMWLHARTSHLKSGILIITSTRTGYSQQHKEESIKQNARISLKTRKNNLWYISWPWLWWFRIGHHNLYYFIWNYLIKVFYW